MIVPVGGGRVIRRRGFANVIELASGDGTRVGGIEVTATEAIHDGRRHKVGPRVEAIGYLLGSSARTVYFAGDTDLFDGMSELAGRLDVALLPIGGWGPKVGAGHLDPRRAAVAAAMLRPRLAIPIHWGTLLRFDLGRRARRAPARAAATLRRSARRARAGRRAGGARAGRVAVALIAGVRSAARPCAVRGVP